MHIEGTLNLDAENYKMKLLGFLLGIIIFTAFSLTDDIKDIKPWKNLWDRF